MREALKHHYVPRFYLEQWAGADGKLHVTKRIGDRLVESRLAPRSTGYEERLYSFRDEPLSRNTQPDVVETKVLSVIDDNGARVHRRLLKEGPGGLTDEERRAWALFLNTMLERDPRHIRKNQGAARGIAEQVIKDVVAEVTDPAGRERIKRITSRFDIHATASNMVLRGMVDELRNERVLKYLEGMWWVVLDMPPQLELYTSNRPFVVNAGQGRAPIDVAWLPLSPSVLFMLFPKSWLPDDATELTEEIEGFFRLVVLHHNTLLHGRSDSTAHVVDLS
jgi:hypothetical protein